MKYQKLAKQYIKEKWFGDWSSRERDEERIKDFAYWLDNHQEIKLCRCVQDFSGNLINKYPCEIHSDPQENKKEECTPGMCPFAPGAVWGINPIALEELRIKHEKYHK